MEDGFSSYSSLYDTSSLLQFCNGKKTTSPLPPPHLLLLHVVDMSPAQLQTQRRSFVVVELFQLLLLHDFSIFCILTAGFRINNER